MMYPMVDVLRGFASISVVVFHVISYFEWKDFPSDGPALWFRNGWMGVDLFFVISGFVISLSAFGRLDREDRVHFRRGFMRARLARIVPLHYLTCALFVAFVTPELIYAPDLWMYVGTHFLFVHNLFFWYHGGPNGVNWSLATEMQFYLLMLIIAPWLRNCRWWIIPVTSILISWCWRWCVFEFVRIDETFGAFPRFVYATELPGALDEFGMGITLARFLRSVRWAWLVDLLSRYSLVPFGCAYLTVSVVLTVFWRDPVFWDNEAAVVIERTLIGIACASVVFSACCLQQWALLCMTAPLRYLGTVSYGIYLWHLGVILILKCNTSLQGGQVLPWVLILTVVLASISWHLFEHPIVRRLAGSTRNGRLWRAKWNIWGAQVSGTLCLGSALPGGRPESSGYVRPSASLKGVNDDRVP